MSNEMTNTKTDENGASNGAFLKATPAVDVYENAEEFLVVADVPGADRDELELELEGSVLRVSAPQSRGDSAGAPTAFHRTFELSNTVDPDAIEADFEQGVLTVRMKKRATARPRKLEVRRPN